MRNFIGIYIPNKPYKKTSDSTSIAIFITYSTVNNQTKKFGGAYID